MHKKPNTHKLHSKKPSKLAMAAALLFAVLLPYILVTQCSHKKENYISHKELLPIIEKEPVNLRPLHTATSTAAVSTAVALVEKQNQTPLQQVKTIASNKIKDNVWQNLYPRQGDSMATIFHRLGLSAQNLHAVMKNNPHNKVLTSIKPGQKLQFLINQYKLEQLIIPINEIQSLRIYRQGAEYKVHIDSKKTLVQNYYVTGLVQGSLYNTAKKLDIPPKLVAQVTDVLNKQISLSSSLRAGDRISLIYEAYFIKDKRVGTGNLLAVSYTNRGKTFQAIRHTHRNGVQEYYSAEGHSFKKAFSRYPINFSHISSTFNSSRYHPILRYRREHKGIDLSAPIGTPIKATGDGVITVIDRHNGYGNMIKIKHDKTYSTIYAHLLKFQRGLSKGSRVTRGQVIGYVGQTGLATGPHCHYELHVNNQPRNPSTINLPTAASIPAREMAGFKARSNALFARLKTIEKTSLAYANKSYHTVG